MRWRGVAGMSAGSGMRVSRASMMSLVSCHVSSSGVTTIGMKSRLVRRRISAMAVGVGRISSKKTRFARKAARALPVKYERSAPKRRNGGPAPPVVGELIRSALEQGARAFRKLLRRRLVAVIVERGDLERHLDAALARRARRHRVHPASQVVETGDVDARPLVRPHPRPVRDVGDRVVVGEPFALREAPVEHLEKPPALVLIAID